MAGGRRRQKLNSTTCFYFNDIFMGLSPAIEPGKVSSGRFPSLDGWRAVSIILVLGEHSRQTGGFPKSLDPLFKWLFDGDLGVRFFFVISGFLITYLLFREYDQTGSVSLRKFYIR